jgi:hypothetical protein
MMRGERGTKASSDGTHPFSLRRDRVPTAQNHLVLDGHTARTAACEDPQRPMCLGVTRRVLTPYGGERRGDVRGCMDCCLWGWDSVYRAAPCLWSLTVFVTGRTAY